MVFSRISQSGIQRVSIHVTRSFGELLIAFQVSSVNLKLSRKLLNRNASQTRSGNNSFAYFDVLASSKYKCSRIVYSEKDTKHPPQLFLP